MGLRHGDLDRFQDHRPKYRRRPRHAAVGRRRVPSCEHESRHRASLCIFYYAILRILTFWLQVKNVYFKGKTGTIFERQSPFKGQTGVWGNDNFSGLYSASSASLLASYWRQDLVNGTQDLAVFFQEIGANSLTTARYRGNRTADLDWAAVRHSILVADGSPFVLAPTGLDGGAGLELYLSDGVGMLAQHAFRLDVDGVSALGDAKRESSPSCSVPYSRGPCLLVFLVRQANPTCAPLTTGTSFQLTKNQPVTVAAAVDNTGLFSSAATVPECTKTTSRLTHLILLPNTPDQQVPNSLSLISWNCSAGFSPVRDTDVAPVLTSLLRNDGGVPEGGSQRTFIALAAAATAVTPPQTQVLQKTSGRATSGRVFVMYDAGDGPQIDEWTVPATGSAGPGTRSWALIGEVPVRP